MPTYIYESLTMGGQEPERFEIRQRMTDAPLTSHPGTGVPVRRVVTGGVGIKGKPVRRSTKIDRSLAAATPCGCSRDALAAVTGAARPSGPPRIRRVGHAHGHRH